MKKRNKQVIMSVISKNDILHSLEFENIDQTNNQKFIPKFKRLQFLK